MTVGATPPLQEGKPPNLDAEYVGSGFCSMCHMQDESWHLSGHSQMVRPAAEETLLGDLSQTEAVTITWPDGSERPITVEDITYVLGGRYMQRYVSVIERGDGTTGYMVLPVQWNVPQANDQQGTWTPFHADDWQEPARDWRVACAGCHTTGLDVETAAEFTDFAPSETWKKGNVELNIGCEACHGPGGLHMANKGTLVKSPDAQICGQCHVQGQDPGGEHGYPVNYQPGLALDETTFVLAAPDDQTAWWPTGHARAYNQYGEWLTSGHGQTRAIGEMCARCHGTIPANTAWTMADVTDGITCAACHDPHTNGLRLPVSGEPAPAATPTPEPTESGADEYADAAPPPEPTQDTGGGDDYSEERQIGFDTAANPQRPAPQREVTLDYTVCVACHNSRTPDGEPMLVMGGRLHHPNQEMFEGWSMVEEVVGVPSAHYSNLGGPLCVTCHMPKTVEIGAFGRVGSHTMMVVIPDADSIQPDSCSNCHESLVSRAALQQFIGDTQAGTEARIAAVEKNIGSRTPDWVSTVLDFIKGDGSLGIHNPAYTDALLDAVEIELGRPAFAPEPTAQPTSETPLPVEAEEAKSTAEAEGGLTTPSLIILLIGGLIVAVAAYAFFIREANYE